MRKSLSLDNVAVARLRERPEEEDEDEVGSRGNGRLPYPLDMEELDGGHQAEREEEEDDGGGDNGDEVFSVSATKSRPSAVDAVPSDKEIKDSSPPPLHPAEIPVIRFHEVEAARPGNGAHYSSLPRPLSRHRNISRSLVPKMRRMFEKARSCDPDLPPLTLSSPVPAGSEAECISPPFLRRMQDGTESTRSSFVLLGAAVGGGSSSPEGSTHTLSEIGGGSPALNDRKSRGFVNKCVTKVKSFMGKSQDRL